MPVLRRRSLRASNQAVAQKLIVDVGRHDIGVLIGRSIPIALYRSVVDIEHPLNARLGLQRKSPAKNSDLPAQS
ncbi:hypothetical protein [Bradyrhizobium diazoefficiens]|uniref:hypothetical protein n=1 Tax=Bradyrhizobium diazoefficiens TaxID=1355477 RepID=UPI001AEDF512|nr:hypothetical protein [Bradyrhizobium diazoefficiens]